MSAIGAAGLVSGGCEELLHPIKRKGTCRNEPKSARGRNRHGHHACSDGFYASSASVCCGSPPPKLSPQASTRLHITPNGYQCDPGWIYDNVVDAGTEIYVVAPSPSGPFAPDRPNSGPAYRAYNGTASNATVAFSATTTGTVSLAVSGTYSVDASAIVAGVNLSLGITVTTSISTTVGHTITITVPPRTAGYGQYAIYRKVTNGHYYYLMSNCAVGTDRGTLTARSPWMPDWNTWTGA